MPSITAGLINWLIRTSIRSKDWGNDDYELARYARRRFGSPKLLQQIKSSGSKIEKVEENAVRGEWITEPGESKGTILYLHGGGYVSCSPATHRPITTTLARLSGFQVFSLDYRLAPEHRFPSATDDALAAYRWLLEQKIDSKKIAVIGDSAGGGLVLITLTRIRDEKLPLPACGVCFSPWTDLTGNSATIRSNEGLDHLFYAENIEGFRHAYLKDASPKDPLASPLFADLGNLPPILLQVGSTELLLDDARSVHQKIQAAGGSSRLEIFDDIFHGWHLLDGIVPESRIALQQAADFITEQIKAAQPSKSTADE